MVSNLIQPNTRVLLFKLHKSTLIISFLLSFQQLSNLALNTMSVKGEAYYSSIFRAAGYCIF